ncbi:hypothetical protein NDU88_006035 [Pleurodeles waltl]|uniref:Uncharacterized protein n=1 Tax=Pleurodeles waltl TaxID=8319 RepID=A0AAV7SNE3_PLEWA|nr:hypothetical protein NDU88_006035 [Pleurodeles waltl]
MKDRKPGWKFRTPYEPSVWVVTRVAGTVVTVQKVGETVSRNVSRFSKGMFEEPQTEEPEMIHPHQSPASDSPEPPSPRLSQPTSTQDRPCSQEDDQSGTQAGEHRSRTQRHNLWPNPPPSQRLKEFVC